MSYSAITSGEIASGEPVSTTTQTKIKDNFADHESRIQTVEAGGNIDYPSINLYVDGYSDGYTLPLEGVLKFTNQFNLRITGARLIIDKAGTSGTTEVDVLVSSSGGAYTSIFSTKPSVAYTDGDDATSSNAVIDTNNDDISAGDIVRLDLESAQVSGRSFLVRLDYEKTGS